jgi:hypothetical protein
MGCCTETCCNLGENYVQALYNSLPLRKYTFIEMYQIITGKRYFINYFGKETLVDKNDMIEKELFKEKCAKLFTSDNICQSRSVTLLESICSITSYGDNDKLNCNKIFNLILPLLADDQIQKVEFFIKINESGLESISPFKATQPRDRQMAHHFIPLDKIKNLMNLYFNNTLLFYTLIVFDGVVDIDTKSTIENNCRLFGNKKYIEDYLVSNISHIFARKIDEFSDFGEALFDEYFFKTLKEKSYIFDFFKLRNDFINSCCLNEKESNDFGLISLESFISNSKRGIDDSK